MVNFKELLLEDIKNMPLFVREDRSGFLNLRNNELVHSQLENLALRSLTGIHGEDISRYNYYAPLESSVASLFNISQESICLGAGSDQMIKTVFEAFRNKISHVILQTPNYYGYAYYSRLYSYILHSLTIGESIEVNEDPVLQGLINREPSIFILTSPDPFFGKVIPDEQIEEFVRKCDDCGHIVVVDEAYSAYRRKNLDGIIGKYRNLIVIRSFSKSFGLAGMRLGVLIADPEVVHYIKHWKTIETVTSLTSKMFCFFHTHQTEVNKLIDDIITGRDESIAELKKEPSVKVYDSKANFITLTFYKEYMLKKVIDYLYENRILVRNLEEFASIPRSVRITATESSVMNFVVSLIKNTIRRTL